MSSKCLTLLQKYLNIVTDLLDTLVETCEDYLNKSVLEIIKEKAHIYRKAAKSINKLSDEDIMMLSSSMPPETFIILIETLEKCTKAMNDIESYLFLNKFRRKLIDERLYHIILIHLHEACDPHANKITQYMRKT